MGAHHEHPHDYGEHGHSRAAGLTGVLQGIFAPHGHDAADSVDDALEASSAGIRAVKTSLVVLGLTALVQAVIVAVSGSVALLADTTHNSSDALTAVPLWIAFVLSRRAAATRFTYGYGRAEDLAGLFVLAMIALSAWDAASAQPLSWLMACTPAPTAPPPRRCSSVPVGWPWASRSPTLSWGWSSPRRSSRCHGELPGTCWDGRWDGVDPGLVATAERALTARPGVREVRTVRMRWVGHDLVAEVELDVDPALPLSGAHRVAHEAEQDLTRAVCKLTRATVHAYPGHDRATHPQHAHEESPEHIDRH